MKIIGMIACIVAAALMAPVCQARGGGGGGGGGHSSGGSGSGGTSGHGNGGSGSGSSYYKSNISEVGSYSFGYRRPFGYIRPGNGNYFTDDETPQYTPMGPTAAGGDVDPTLPRTAFVKTYSWPRKQ